jgi:SAM-dependent methyltransferase
MQPLPLVCPDDHRPLELRGERLVCGGGHEWPVRSGIGRLVPGETNYADAFGLQWAVYRRTQLDSHTGTTISADRVRRCLGPDVIDRLRFGETADVLEVGCGAGRFTEVLLGFPKARVTSVDYSSAVEANAANCPQDDRHRVVQADLRRLPFEPMRFDVVLCLGVVQHTPDPEESIARLYEQVKPGGWLVIDHYTYNLGLFTKPGWLLRPILKRLPPGRGLAWTDRLVGLCFPVHRALRRPRLLQKAVAALSPVYTYFHVFPELDDRQQREWALLDTHDALTDWYKHLRSPRQIERALTGLGAEAVRCARGGNGVEARCRRPSAAVSGSARNLARSA